jgi:hypothetical protein
MTTPDGPGQLTLLQGAPILDALNFETLRFEDGQRELDRLVQQQSERPRSRNEATTRRVLVEKLLFGCLGWLDDEVVSEDNVSGAGFTDYTLSLPRPIVIVEAKREGANFDLPSGVADTIKLGALVRISKAIKDAVDQVARYCQQKGVQFAVITNGHQVITFAAIRTDGVQPIEGNAIVFRSLTQMRDDFTRLWNLLSRSALLQQALAKQLLRPAAERIPLKPSQSIVAYPGIKGRNPLQADLKSVSELVLEDITRSREMEPRFLRECYCSNGALSQYSLLGRAMLKTRYAALTDSENPGPTTVAITRDHVKGSILVESFARRPILLLGDVGVGKTTFIKHLLDLDDRELLESLVILYLDLGTRQSLALDIREAILNDLSTQLIDKYEVDIEADAFVRAVYHSELLRFAGSINKSLRDSKPEAFREREVKFLDQKLNLRDEHLKRSLEHLYMGRHKQNVIIIDNCDQRNVDDQQQAFLIGQEIADGWPALVFLSLRPETFHASRKRGTLTGYHPKAFTIAPPRIDEVISKRLSFALQITTGALPVATHFGGITVRLENLDALIRVFQQSLRENKALIECIENISGSNVRLALDLIRDFFGSGHVATGKILQIYSKQGSYFIPLHEFLRASLYGDNVYFDPSNSRIVNVFDVSAADSKEHFIVLLLLSLLQALSTTQTESGFVRTDAVYNGLQGIGFTAAQVDAALLRCISRKLVESVARQIPEPGTSPPAMLRITSVGAYHLMRLTGLFVYYDAVVVDTPIFDQNVAKGIRDVHELEERAERARIFLQYLNDRWHEAAFEQPWLNWLGQSSEAMRDAERAVFRKNRYVSPVERRF